MIVSHEHNIIRGKVYRSFQTQHTRNFVIYFASAVEKDGAVKVWFICNFSAFSCDYLSRNRTGLEKLEMR